MHYKVGDILVCEEIFSTDKNYIVKDIIYDADIQFPGRVIGEGDVYEIVDLDFVTKQILYIKHIRNSITYANDIPITISQVDKYFICKRIERLKKLQKLNKI